MKLLFAIFLLSLFVATNGVDISHRASARSGASHSPLQGAMQDKNKSKKKISELEKAFAADQEVQKKERVEVAQQQKAIEELRRTLQLTVQREGKPGRDGRDGQQGPPGKDGRPGTKGNPGRDGRDGATGPSGQPGTGIKGDKGDRGDKGDDGLGLTLQAFRIGKTYKEGDYVFHTGRTGGDAMFIAQGSFKALSVPSKDHTNWLQFQAPRGRPGEPGKAGANGKNGVDAQPGRDGKHGRPGVRGAPGRDGQRGVKGDTGSRGPPGPRGATGAKWVPPPPPPGTVVKIRGTVHKTSKLQDGGTISLSAESRGGTGITSTHFTVSKTVRMGLSLWGAGGGGTKRTSSRTGGDGGYAYGEYTFVPGKTYYVVVGGAGIGGSEKCNSPDKYSCADTGCGLCQNPTSGSGDGAAGGGYTGVFEDGVSIHNAIIVAGGGGGASGDIAYGGHGGGESGKAASNYNIGRGGEGGQHNRGGSGNRGGGRGEALKGGRSNDHGGGGGGGYYGGGGGGNHGPGGGGGGSSFISKVDNGVTRTGGDGVISRKYYQSGVGRGGASGSRGGGGLLVMVRMK